MSKTKQKIKAWGLIENGKLLRWEQGGKIQPDIFFTKKEAENARMEWDGNPKNLIRVRVIEITYPLF